ncbi:2330_t:CDS:2, partial [Gigaspora rosea]
MKPYTKFENEFKKIQVSMMIKINSLKVNTKELEKLKDKQYQEIKKFFKEQQSLNLFPTTEPP